MTEIHGHRGCNEGVPPNTIPAFLRAAEAGCHWIELDVVITGDGHVLVSHEPWMDHASCVDPSGQPITEQQGRALNIFRMPLAEIQAYRVQVEHGEGTGAPKPTLAEAAHAMQRWSAQTGRAMPGFNVEIKSEAAAYGQSYPLPDRTAALVTDALERSGLSARCLVQSFDPAVLEAMHRRARPIPLALLVENNQAPAANLQRLTFAPAYYSPNHGLIDGQLIALLRAQNIGVLAWTVNELADMKRMLSLGVDGLITDNPGRALALLAETPQ